MLSPSGQWIVYYITFDADPSKNGLWLVRTDGSERRQLDREVFGAYQWREGARGQCHRGPRSDPLLVVPLGSGGGLPSLCRDRPGDRRSAKSRLRIPPSPPSRSPTAIGEFWPDGRHVAFVESSDLNIWALELPQ